VVSTAEEDWERFYRERPRAWGEVPRPNPLLVREVSGLPPGTALDLGCGEGGDALWLAEHGWLVTAADVAPTALARAAERAEQVGLSDRITFEQHDLAATFPAGRFNLVSAQFLHVPADDQDVWARIVRRAAEAVAPDGRLLIVGHGGWPPWMDHPPAAYLPTNEETLAALAPDPDAWEVEVAERVDREITGPDGQRALRPDHVLRLRRR
jgi:SAM-dependent methyltransferase